MFCPKHLLSNLRDPLRYILLIRGIDRFVLADRRIEQRTGSKTGDREELFYFPTAVSRTGGENRNPITLPTHTHTHIWGASSGVG